MEIVQVGIEKTLRKT